MKDTIMSARAVLSCRPNSHPFQDRNFILEQPVKIGRSVARSRPNTSNAIFDCKVLSRNHALLWYENGKFFLQDTKSSNGTFVNNQRLSKSSEESLPFQVSSGDILQFGVDVMEVTKKDPTNRESVIDAVTHGCIVATLTLYLPDGKEAKASSSAQLIDKSQHPTTHEMYQINQVVKEALNREQLIDTKLASVTKLLGSTKTMMADSWKSLIEEDRLITKVDGLQRQLQMSHKNVSEDKLRDEIRQLHEDKEKYQTLAKQKLKEHAMEKLESLKKVNDLESKLSASEEEHIILKDLCDRTNEELTKMAEKYDEAEKKANELALELNQSKDSYKTEMDRLNKNLKEEHELLIRKQQLLDTVLSKIDTQNSATTNNSIKNLLLSMNSNSGGGDGLENDDDLSHVLNNNSQHNNNILVDSSITSETNSANNSDNNHQSTRGPATTTRVVVDDIDDDDKTTAIDNLDAIRRNQYLLNTSTTTTNDKTTATTFGLDLKQLHNILTDLMSLCEEFRKLSTDNNYSETIVQLINKVNLDINQIRKLTVQAKDTDDKSEESELDRTFKRKSGGEGDVEDEVNKRSSDEICKKEELLDIGDGINVGKRTTTDFFGNINKKEGYDEDVDELNGNQILSEAREQIKTLQNERQQLMEKVDSLQVQSTDSLKRARLYENIAKDLERVTHDQGIQLKTLKEQMTEHEKIYTALQAELKAKEDVALANEQTILQLRDEMCALQEDKTEKDERVALLRSQINDLSQKQNTSSISVSSIGENDGDVSSDATNYLNASFTSSESESLNTSLRSELVKISARLLETEEELSIFKDQYNKSSSQCLSLERELLEQKNCANTGQWVSLKWIVPILIIILAVLIVFHPNS